MDSFAIFQPEYLEQLEQEQQVISGIVKQFQKLVTHVKEFSEELGFKLEVDYENYIPGQTVSLERRQRRKSSFWMPNFTAIARREENLIAQIEKNNKLLPKRSKSAGVGIRTPTKRITETDLNSRNKIRDRKASGHWSALGGDVLQYDKTLIIGFCH